MAFARVSNAKERISVLDGSRVTRIYIFFAMTFW